jgi:LDH2 family malate/lactate/ureidoglycolate dehydrogenase
MNLPPTEFIRVPHGDLAEFVAAIAEAVGMPSDMARKLGRWLAENDLRGTFSHGSRQIVRYAGEIASGQINPAPLPRVVSETPVSLKIDGDGGHGHFALYEGAERLVSKVEEHGAAVLSTSNHGHIGAAGLYTRLFLEHDMLAFCCAGNELALTPGEPVYRAAGAAPMSFSVPAGEEDALVLDFGTMKDLYQSSPNRVEIERLAPGLVFRCIGLGAVSQAFGGLLGGDPVDRTKLNRRWPKAAQGALMFAFNISLFIEPDRFKQEMDEYVRAVRRLTPLEGFGEAYLPGGRGAASERENREKGVPVGKAHREALENIAREFGVETPWRV